MLENLAFGAIISFVFPVLLHNPGEREGGLLGALCSPPPGLWFTSRVQKSLPPCSRSSPCSWTSSPTRYAPCRTRWRAWWPESLSRVTPPKPNKRYDRCLGRLSWGCPWGDGGSADLEWGQAGFTSAPQISCLTCFGLKASTCENEMAETSWSLVLAVEL